jgi:hypothetical protein
VQHKAMAAKRQSLRHGTAAKMGVEAPDFPAMIK